MMTNVRPSLPVLLGLSLLLSACSGGGGGGGGSEITAKSNAKQIQTIATVGRDGSWARVDLVDGGVPATSKDPADPGNQVPNPAKQQFLNRLMSVDGADFDDDLADTNGDGVPDSGFDSYSTGLVAGKDGGRILGANNLYDLFQSTTGLPVLFNSASGTPGGPPFIGGDVTLDGVPDGGPGLFSNLGPTISPVPALPVIPNTMGDLDPVTESGRGPSPSDQHQFIQIVFPYKLDRASLFDPFNPGNSFLGDSTPGATANVFIEKRWVARDAYIKEANGNDNTDVNVVDHTFLRRHVPGIAIIGGVTAIPFQQGFQTLTTVDKDLSNLPEGCKELVDKPNVFTFIAHENPAGISQVSPVTLGRIQPDGTLVLPDPVAPGGLGGRVFGASEDIPSAVNDFRTNPYDPQVVEQLEAQEERRVGFFFVKIARLRSNKGVTIDDAYFHSFPVSQQDVAGTPPGGGASVLDPMSIDGSFNRGPAIPVDSVTKLPTIDVLDPGKHYLPPVAFPTSDAVNRISTRAKFYVEFDKEVVPNSVGFSRQYTVHSVEGKGIVFPFSGNTRPVTSPASSFTGGAAAPLAPSIFLAVNQPVQRAVNNPFAKDANQDGQLDTGEPILPGNPTQAEQDALPGLFPAAHNTLATLPRGVVPCDIYPINQNNLQKYVVEPLVELPPNTIVTLGVTVQGLGLSNNNLPAGFPTATTNMGNFTRSGTVFTPYQGLTAVGVGDPTVAGIAAIIPNRTVIKVNAGPMDLEGRLFFGGTDVAIDTLLDGDGGTPPQPNNATHGGFNVCRTFRVGNDAERTYVNAPVSPMALYTGFGDRGIGVVDLNGTGFNTNEPGGGSDNVGFENLLISSRWLPAGVSPSGLTNNWNSTGSAASGDHFPAFGVISRYVAGSCAACTTPTYESELAIGAPIGVGSGATPAPGINEGSSGYETMVRNNKGGQFLTPSKVGLVRDILVGDFLDTVYFDSTNPFASSEGHRTYNAPAEGAIQNNTIADPPFPNPPPLKFPVGLPHTSVVFDQDDLTKPPVLIDGAEVFGGDGFVIWQPTPQTPPVSYPANTFIQLNPTTNASNPTNFDVPPLPNTGYVDPFQNSGSSLAVFPKFTQTGPLPKSSTSGARLLVNVNTGGAQASPSDLRPVLYFSRQQIGNFLFVTDGVNKKLHALNSNTMEIVESLQLPDPYGLGLTNDLDTLFVSNEGDNSVSVVDADPRSATFMTEIQRVKVGDGPRAVAVTPDDEDVLVVNRLGNSVSIIDVGTNTVRRTLSQSGLNRPNDVTSGMREVSGGPAFQSGTYHAFISNGGGNNVLVYESGPAGVAGIGFDNIIGPVTSATSSLGGLVEMVEPRGITYDPNAPYDAFAHTVGCFVAHNSPDGEAMISRIAYQADSAPGVTFFDATFANPSFGEKVFEVRQQYKAGVSGIAHDVVLADYNRTTFEQSEFKTHSNLLNAGASIAGLTGGISGTIFERNTKYPLASNVSPAFVNGPRWNPDRLYLAVGGVGIVVFTRDTAQKLNTIPTDATPTVLGTYFEQ